MRGFRLTERSVALVCAIVLVAVSVTAVWRHYDNQQQDAAAPAEKSQQQTSQPESQDSDAQDEQPATTTEQPAPTKKTQESSQTTYAYTAVAGSSYTEFARQAIASYAQTHQLTLTEVDTINSEVALANNAGAPLLEIGQQVNISHGDVANALQAAGVVATADTSPVQKPSTQDYTFTAQAGDSYTEFARQAIATYAKSISAALTPAQRVAAETYLTQAAGAPQLAIGQQVAISQSDVQSAVARAQQLSTAQQAAWQAYADTVSW